MNGRNRKIPTVSVIVKLTYKRYESNLIVHQLLVNIEFEIY